MTVYLVGAGPGDPGLLTVRGADVLGAAEIVVHDGPSVAALLELAPAAAERIGVGEQPDRAAMPQHRINDLLIEHGRAGQEVVRLTLDDPFAFARGGEEAQALLQAGVSFEVVPGVTSAAAVPAYAGIPLTMPQSPALLTVLTGHEDPDQGGEPDWEPVARLGGTIVVPPGVGRLLEIVESLRAGGLPDDTPVAVIRSGTRPEQSTVRTTLGAVPAHELERPSTIVIGRVAGMDLAWFENRPLFGRKVLVTRARRQAPALVSRLQARGAHPIVVPTIEIGEPADRGAALRAAAQSVDGYDWVVLTSANGAHRFFAELTDARALGGVRVAAIGPATADVIRSYNVVADLVPERYVAESLLEAFPPPTDGRPGRVLLARAATAREVLPEGLRRKGWDVEVVESYRTHLPDLDDEARSAALDADVVTFTSSSTVTNYVRVFGRSELPPVVACIGPVTATTAREEGLPVDVVADDHSVPGLVAALERHLAG